VLKTLSGKIAIWVENLLGIKKFRAVLSTANFRFGQTDNDITMSSLTQMHIVDVLSAVGLYLPNTF